MASTIQTAPALGESIGQEWRHWGPYLSDRQWGTVREDYSDYGTAWDFFPHDHARSRAYRWGEDGIFGFSDDKQFLCFAIALWNGNDPILKERFFGLTGSEGNHGEDVKEAYFYLDATPTHSYLKALYKYPQAAFPYNELVEANRGRSKDLPEYEVIDTGVFANERYFDVEVEYAKVGPDDTLIRVSATNRGPDAASLHVLPTLWFRNTWSWGRDDRRPELAIADDTGETPTIHATHHKLGEYWLACGGLPELHFTENETNAARLFGADNRTPYVKDGIENAVIHGQTDAVNPAQAGTKAAAHYTRDVASGATEVILLRLSATKQAAPFTGAAQIFTERIAEADKLYADVTRGGLTEDEARVQRQALAGLIWSKQYFNYDVAQWLDGDPGMPEPSAARRTGRNSQWRHHNAGDVISMPDKWEYPWYAAWDLAFHTIAFDLVDPGFAKDQLLLMLREWYMHPNGQMPAYEWAFGDVNPPVHIAATRAIYQNERRRGQQPDRQFLARVFHKLLINFTWWVNRKDSDGQNVFQGGFLGLDNISVIDRSMVLPAGVTLEQADGTAWMASYCLNMAWAAVELSREDPTYEDLAVKFVEHYYAIGAAINGLRSEQTSLWDEEDGFYYDQLRSADGRRVPLRVRSLVGLLPIVSAIALEPEDVEQLRNVVPGVIDNLAWFREHHPELEPLGPRRTLPDGGQMRLLTLVPEDRLRRVLARLFDPNEFLSDYGIRAISRVYLDQPFQMQLQDQWLSVKYEPAESTTGMFGGNSNWRGPIWFPMNFLLLMGLRQLHRYYGEEFQIEFPTGSGKPHNLGQIADHLSRRMISIFLRGEDGRRPVFGWDDMKQNHPHWRDHILFYEYFHGDNGAGVGASHQTGWTAVVANLLERIALANAPSPELADEDQGVEI